MEIQAGSCGMEGYRSVELAVDEAKIGVSPNVSVRYSVLKEKSSVSAYSVPAPAVQPRWSLFLDVEKFSDQVLPVALPLAELVCLRQPTP
jgi:hypothetical protein